MDITPVGRQGYKIKGKTASVVVEDNKVKIERDKPFVITSPGEFEAGGVSVIGVQSAAGSIYIVELDNLRVCTFTEVGEKLSDLQIEEIGPVDIVVLQNLNQEIAKQVDPWVILTETPVNDVSTIAKYSVTSDKLPTETTTVVLERK